MYGKTLINGPVRESENILVILKSTGSLVSLDRKEDFSPRLHQYLPSPSVRSEAPVAPQPVEAIESVPEKAPVQDAATRLEELKAKGREKSPKNPFIGLSKEEKEEYSRLNDQLNV